MATFEKQSELESQANQEPVNPPSYNATTLNDQGQALDPSQQTAISQPSPAFIQREDSPSLQPGQRPANVAQASREQRARMVTPLDRLGAHEADVDCERCQRVVRTRVVKHKQEPSGLMILLICLVCWPLLCCLPALMGGEENIDHYCTGCGRHLTHKPHDGPVRVVASASPAQVTSKYN